jgi:predicted signal transduction protein with EAL and GGDEF domain
MATALRAEDVVCRLGGEEFAVLAAISPDHLCAFGERIREGVERYAPYRITVSVGATWSAPSDTHPDEPEQVWALLDRADELMYLAKNDGRNRLRAATSDKGAHPSISSWARSTDPSRGKCTQTLPASIVCKHDVVTGSESW